MREEAAVTSKRKLKKDPYEPDWTPKRNQPPTGDQPPKHIKKRRKKPYGIKVTWFSRLWGERDSFQWYETQKGRDQAIENLARKDKLMRERYPKWGTRRFEKAQRD